MSRGRRKFQFYGPAHFRATWAKFLEICERDDQSASGPIRIWVEGYVRRKDPGNPQRPMTTWVPGHEDELALQEREIIDKLKDYTSRRRNGLTVRRIMDELRPFAEGRARLQAAERIARELRSRGVKVWR